MCRIELAMVVGLIMAHVWMESRGLSGAPMIPVPSRKEAFAGHAKKCSGVVGVMQEIAQGNNLNSCFIFINQ